MLEGPEFKGNIGNVGSYEVDLTEELKLNAKVEFNIDLKDRVVELLTKTSLGQKVKGWLEKVGVEI